MIFQLDVYNFQTATYPYSKISLLTHDTWECGPQSQRFVHNSAPDMPPGCGKNKIDCCHHGLQDRKGTKERNAKSLSWTESDSTAHS